MNSKLPPPDATQTPIKNPVADAMITLGVLTAACETAEPGLKAKCKSMLKPLEQNQSNATETLADIIVEMGEESLDDAADRFNFIMYAATQRAKEKLIALGKLNADGTPVNQLGP